MDETPIDNPLNTVRLVHIMFKSTVLIVQNDISKEQTNTELYSENAQMYNC